MYERFGKAYSKWKVELSTLFIAPFLRYFLYLSIFLKIWKCENVFCTFPFARSTQGFWNSISTFNRLGQCRISSFSKKWLASLFLVIKKMNQLNYRWKIIFLHLTILTAKNSVSLSSVQEWLVGCFWPFWHVYTIN